jgi:O-antigen ligase
MTLKQIFKRFLLVSFFVPLFYDLGPIGIATWTGPFLALGFVYALERALGRRQARVRGIGSWEVSAIVFILWMYLSTILNEYYYPDPNRDGLLLVYVMSIFFALFVRRNWGALFDRRTIIRFAFAMIAVQFVVGMAQLLTGSAIGFPGAYLGAEQSGDIQTHTGAGRVIGSLDSTPTVLARAIAVLLPFVAVHASDSAASVLQKTCRVAGLLGGGAVILMTQSRSALLIVGIVGALWMLSRSRIVLRQFFRLRTTWSGLLFLYSSVALLALGVGVLQQSGGISGLQQAVTSTLYRFENVALFGIRFELMRGAVILFQEQPLLGNGYLSTKYLAEQTDILVPDWRSYLRVHHAYLQFLAEGGIVGFLSFSYFTIYPIYRLYTSDVRRTATYYAFFAAIAMMIIFSQSSTAYDRYSLAPIYMMILGGAMGFLDRFETEAPHSGSLSR